MEIRGDPAGRLEGIGETVRAEEKEATVRLRQLVVCAAAILAASQAHAGSSVSVGQVPEQARAAGDGLRFSESRMLDGLKARAAGLSRGRGNVASIVQEGDRNQSTVIQSGRANTAMVEILAGSGNTTTQIQTGDRNSSYVAIDRGSNNTVSTRQTGSDNYLGLELRETNNTNVTWNQTGSGINASGGNIVIDTTLQSSSPIVIEQK